MAVIAPHADSLVVRDILIEVEGGNAYLIVSAIIDENTPYACHLTYNPDGTISEGYSISQVENGRCMAAGLFATHQQCEQAMARVAAVRTAEEVTV